MDERLIRAAQLDSEAESLRFEADKLRREVNTENQQCDMCAVSSTQRKYFRTELHLYGYSTLKEPQQYIERVNLCGGCYYNFLEKFNFEHLYWSVLNG